MTIFELSAIMRLGGENIMKKFNWISDEDVIEALIQHLCEGECEFVNSCKADHNPDDKMCPYWNYASLAWEVVETCDERMSSIFPNYYGHVRYRGEFTDD